MAITTATQCADCYYIDHDDAAFPADPETTTKRCHPEPRTKNTKYDVDNGDNKKEVNGDTPEATFAMPMTGSTAPRVPTRIENLIPGVSGAKPCDLDGADAGEGEMKSDSDDADQCDDNGADHFIL